MRARDFSSRYEPPFLHIGIRSRKRPSVFEDIPLRRGTIGRGWIYLLAHSGVRPRSLRFMREKKRVFLCCVCIYMNIFIYKFCDDLE